MFFVLLTFFAALFIEGLGSLVSVIGISALFGANPIIIALAISLDVGKIVVVSLLYTYWSELSKLMKTYALTAAAVTMVITSAGAAGYLSAAFQTAIIGTKESELKVNVLKEQQAKYQERKKQIDDQIAKLPEKTTVSQRLRLMNGFKAEQKALDDKITAIDKELPDAQVKQIGVEAKAGPILYIAKAFDVSVEEAVKWVIAMIIFVFDPLAIFLIIAGNFLWARRKNELATKDFYRPEGNGSHVETLPEPQVDPVTFNPAPSQPTEGQYREAADGSVEIFMDGRWQLLTKQEEVDFGPPIGVEFPNEEPRPREPEEPLLPPEPAPVPEPEPIPEQEKPLEPGRPTYVQTGLLSPVNVDLDIPTNRIDLEHLPAIEQFDEPLAPEPKKREEITRSSLGIVEPDPATIVDAGRLDGFRHAAAAVTPPKR